MTKERLGRTPSIGKRSSLSAPLQSEHERFRSIPRQWGSETEASASPVEQRMVRSVAIERRAREPTSLASAVLGRLLERCRTPDARSLGPGLYGRRVAVGRNRCARNASAMHSCSRLPCDAVKFKIANPECRHLSNLERLRPRASTRAASSVEAKGLTRYSMAPDFRRLLDRTRRTL